jgi:hypothetical protein
MKYAASMFLLLAGCSTTVAVSLPLHKESVSVPRVVEPQLAERYVAGYEAAWLKYLRLYARDIDHRSDFLEESMSASSVEYARGWLAGLFDFEALVGRMIATYGREAAKAKLVAALEKKENSFRPEVQRSGSADGGR